MLQNSNSLTALKKLSNVFLFFLVLLICSSYFFAKQVFAGDEFYKEMDISYNVTEEGVIEAEYQIRIRNLMTERFLEMLVIELEGVDPIEPKLVENGETKAIIVSKEGDRVLLSADFSQKVVGRDKVHEFLVVYKDKSTTSKNGQVWEMIFPKIPKESGFENINVEVKIPKSFGKLAFVSPQPLVSTENSSNYLYYFDTEKTRDKGISMAFGQFQYYSFSLTYHLENPINKESEVEIAIPPDTSLQKVIIESFKPVPSSTYVDLDGNWKAKYNLKERQRLDVVLVGYIQAFSSDRLSETLIDELKRSYLKQDEYWEVNSDEIQKLAKELKTPRAIYDYTVSSLSYNFSRVGITQKRKGALGALYDPTDSVCVEFTDVFVALSRAAGIPAREVNGYAYALNSKVQPLSLVSDVLHAWAEYWDEKTGKWVVVDPTWGSTAQGVDYFAINDMKHLTFVFHGTSSKEPIPPGSYKLGANPQKDVFVALATSPERREINAEIEITKDNKFRLGTMKILVRIKNIGVFALRDEDVEIYFDRNKTLSFPLSGLIPFEERLFEFEVTTGLIGRLTPSQIEVKLGESVKNYNTNRSIMIFKSLTMIACVLLTIIFLVYVRFWKKIWKKNLK